MVTLCALNAYRFYWMARDCVPRAKKQKYRVKLQTILKMKRWSQYWKIEWWRTSLPKNQKKMRSTFVRIFRLSYHPLDRTRLLIKTQQIIATVTSCARDTKFNVKRFVRLILPCCALIVYWMTTRLTKCIALRTHRLSCWRNYKKHLVKHFCRQSTKPNSKRSLKNPSMNSKK